MQYVPILYTYQYAGESQSDYSDMHSRIWKYLYSAHAPFYKKLSCRFVSLNILLSHSRSLKVIRNDTADYRACVSTY